jgi:hypothetical protein
MYVDAEVEARRRYLQRQSMGKSYNQREPDLGQGIITCVVNQDIAITDIRVDGGFPIPDINQLDSESLDGEFSGIIHHIWVSSGRRYNPGEIAFTYLSLFPHADSDPSYIFDYAARNRYGTGPSQRGQFFGVCFQRMDVCPLAYAIKTDYVDGATNHLRSWAFQARRNTQSDWITLDEHQSTTSLCRMNAHIINYVHTQDWYRHFRILQTGVSHRGFLSFNLSGFEIHGWVHRDTPLHKQS